MNRRKGLSILWGTLAIGLLSGSVGASAEDTQLSLLVDNAPHTIAVSQALVAAFQDKNPDIAIEIETRPSGGEGDNIVKTRLATGQMTDVFWYNSGALLQALAPTRTLLDLADQPYAATMDPAFKAAVSMGGEVFGVPTRPAEAFGILYNRRLYAELGLQVPRTWADFMKNNEAIKAAGHTAVIQTYRDTWTSQILVLADYYNVQRREPDWAARFTANKVKYADDPVALKGFERLKAVHDGGFLNEDFGAAGYEDGLRMLAEGEGAHYPMLTFAIQAIAELYPDRLADIGFFSQPGEDAADNGLTTWLPAAFYIPRSTSHAEEAKRFLAFAASPEGCAVQNKAAAANGPYLVQGCSLPADLPAVVRDVLAYFDAGKTAPALEYLSPVKGPQLEQLTVEVGSGIRQPEDAARLYDKDVARQAQQLGLPGW
ncbi:ABC transporter substrate-binding protein [Aureimonas sp. AU40]|uniref:ABC transporter substrate-binding protein n=1 Tax=Aureimonas sp. AU40 TaxID=1637747 RepID=UPI000780C792|nr:extracellular solute-binding protein [Aureimonas sp. AU40]